MADANTQRMKEAPGDTKIGEMVKDGLRKRPRSEWSWLFDPPGYVPPEEPPSEPIREWGWLFKKK